MYENESITEERTDLDDRSRRALEQYLTVLPNYDRSKAADSLFMVVSQSGSEYLVDLKLGACECPDAEYRGVTCKHQRRVEYAVSGVPADLPDGVDADPNLGEHVETVGESDADATSSEQAIATDGGLTVRVVARR